MGKPITESTAEVEKCSWVCSFYADNGKKFLEPEYIDTDAKDSFVRFDPLRCHWMYYAMEFPILASS